MKRWSRKFDECRKCHTSEKKGKHKHMSRGSCRSCWDKERYKTEDYRKRKAIVATSWLLKVKDTEKYRENRRKSVEKHLKSSAHEAHLFKKYMNLKITRFLKGGRKCINRIQIACVCGKRINTPFRPEDIENSMTALELFRKEAKKYCSNHI